MPANRKFDYSGDAFYEEIYTLAKGGMTDAEIADGLSDKFGETLKPETFSRMKNGKYEGWNDDENKQNSTRICQALTRGRRKINSIVRGTYLAAALGGKKVRNKSLVYAKWRCECHGEDNNCPECHGTGWVVSTSKAVVSEAEVELPPNIQALATWLRNHDDTWEETSEQTIASDITQGINIERWILDNIQMREDTSEDSDSAENGDKQQDVTD